MLEKEHLKRDTPSASCLFRQAGNSGCRSLVRTPGQAIKLSFCL